MTTAVQDKDRADAPRAVNASIERAPRYYQLKADVEDFYYQRG